MLSNFSKKMSQREVSKKYKELLKQVETDDYYKCDLTNRVNCYVCSRCSHITKTKDVDSGVTPFQIECEACKSAARSTFYKDMYPNITPTQEWYRPTLEEVMKMRNKPALLQHILSGGLSLRKVKTKVEPC